MKKTMMSAVALGLSLFAVPAAAQSEACTFEGDVYDLDEAGVAALYACIDDTLAASYAADNHPVGSVYRDWQVTSTGAYVPGVHGNRLLLTFANDVAYDDYVQYRFEEGFTMPTGSVLAKESFSLTNDGAPRVGPLFIMTKVDAGEADEFDNWVYSAVRANGKPMNISQSFCHDCHAAYVDQDSMGYPAPDVRFETE